MPVTFASIVAGNWGAELFVGIAYLQSAITFAMSLWKGSGRGSRLDWLSFLIAVLGFVLWMKTGKPYGGYRIFNFGGCSRLYTGIYKTRKSPRSEGPWFYATGAAAAFFGLIAYPLAIASAFEIYIILSCLAMVPGIYR